MLAICCYRRIFPEEILVGGSGDVHHDTVGGWRGVTFQNGGFLHHVLFFVSMSSLVRNHDDFASFLQ